MTQEKGGSWLSECIWVI